MLVQVRGDMIVLILATDMARHAEILDNFRQKLDNFDYSSEVYHPNEKIWHIRNEIELWGEFCTFILECEHLSDSNHFRITSKFLGSPQIF